MDNQKINELQTRLSTQYGTNLRSRIRKLKEEITELETAEDDLREAKNTHDGKRIKETLLEFCNELSDVAVILWHIRHLVGATEDELLTIATRKLNDRETTKDLTDAIRANVEILTKK